MLKSLPWIVAATILAAVCVLFVLDLVRAARIWRRDPDLRAHYLVTGHGYWRFALDWLWP